MTKVHSENPALRTPAEASRARPAVGRPPRITRRQIAHAALEIGLHEATVRNVADKLGMSVPGLYHHVRTRQQLLDIAMQHVLTGLPASWHDRLPWADKLHAYAAMMFAAMAAQPDLVARIASGSFVSVEYLFHIEAFMTGARAHGFTAAQGYDMHRRLLTTVVGAATIEAGSRALTGAGTTLSGAIGAIVGGHASDELPHLHDLLRDEAAFAFDPFDAVRMMLATLTARFGEGATA